MFWDLYSSVYTKTERYLNKRYTKRYTSISNIKKDILVFKKETESAYCTFEGKETIDLSA